MESAFQRGAFDAVLQPAKSNSILLYQAPEHHCVSLIHMLPNMNVLLPQNFRWRMDKQLDGHSLSRRL